jgi:hypothetical protein
LAALLSCSQGLAGVVGAVVGTKAKSCSLLPNSAAQA